MRKKVMCYLMVSIFCLYGLGILSSCSVIPLYEREYFIYTVIDKSKKVGILGLTDKGKEQEYLVIPETIDGNKVTYIRYSKKSIKEITKKYGDEKYAGIQSNSLKKIFVIPEIRVFDGEFFQLETSQAAVFYISKDINIHDNINHYKYYTIENRAGSLKNHKANVLYYYNYEDSPNEGYYWIDNYEYGDTIEYIPAHPIREGYRFGGWYKESECINAWDFEVDTLPEVQYDEEQKEIYQETKLYAKWI